MKKVLLALLLTVVAVLPVTAEPYDFRAKARFREAVKCDSTLAVTGAVTLSTPLTVASANSAIDRKITTVHLRGLAVQALDDSTTFKALITPGRAGTLKQVSIAAITKPAGGTNTVMVKKNDTTDMLAANFDPTTLTDVVASKPALHGTAANLAFTATDTISVVWTTGVQTIDAVGPTVTLEYELTDF